MICPACRHDNPERAKFCLECGQRFLTACPHCGTELPPGAKFCLECGHRLAATDAAPAAAPVAQPVAADFQAKLPSYTPKHLAQKILTSRSALEGERRQVTVLFTDVVGSTEKAAALGDRKWHELLDSYYSLARRELTRFRGREVDTAGDGFFAAFDGPARAIRCAEAISKGVRPLGIEVRAGLHTGECEVIGEKVGGIAVHIGARIMGYAGANEILVSSTVKDLVVGSGIKFEPRGVHAMKGVPGRWHLYAVTP